MISRQDTMYKDEETNKNGCIVRDMKPYRITIKVRSQGSKAEYHTETHYCKAKHIEDALEGLKGRMMFLGLEWGVCVGRKSAD